jgi:ABC-type branched-subunit amino acid transport system substrate-binding protein
MVSPPEERHIGKPGGKPMKRFRWVALVMGVAMVMASSAVGAGAGTARAAKPTASSDVGITPTEIKIAVVADVDTPLAPGLFQGVVDGFNGFAKYINAQGGLAGRKVVVDFHDSKLNGAESRNAMITSCQSDFAVVAAALFLANVDDVEACKDSTGAATGLPDLATLYTSLAQQCSKTTYAVNPPAIVCSTKDAHPQTYQANVGRANYYKANPKLFGKDLHGIFIDSADLKSARDAQFVGQGGIFDNQVGIKLDGEFPLGGSVPQSAYTPVVQAIKSSGSTLAQCGNPPGCTIKLRKEAKLQGVSSVKIWDCNTTCYDPTFIPQGGADVEGEYVQIGFLPFEEAKSNPMLANFLKYTGKDKANGYSAIAFATGLLLRDAVNAVVKQAGNDGLTRKALFTALNGIHKFDADGMYGTTADLAAKKITDCYVLMQVKNGKYVRVFPAKAGTFDCSPKNVIQRKLDLLQG